MGEVSRGVASARHPGKLFSYVVTHDTGFAPNPFFGYCTLACCKPAIRREASVGDWIVGLAPKALGNGVVYAMNVEEKLTFQEYWNDPRFMVKRPEYETQCAVHQRGDNIYEPRGRGFRQLRSRHSNACSENLYYKAHDLKGQYVLVSRNYVYFGSAAVALPNEFQDVVVRRGYKCRFPPAMVEAFGRWLSSYETGVHAAPRSWPPGESSWVEARTGNRGKRKGSGAVSGGHGAGGGCRP